MVLGVIGLGLMGGSLALAAKKSGVASRVVGYDARLDHCNEALKRKLVDEIVEHSELLRCDIVILAIPVEAIKEWLSNLTELPETTTIIDLGSTKEEIIASIPTHFRANFVAAHPMTGTEFSGPAAAFETLYSGKTVVLCNLDESGPLHKERALLLFQALQMRIIEMGAHEHDRHAAFISHLPHILSYSLANTVLEQEDRGAILALAAGGFRDMSRLAKSSPEMWRDIFKQNKENLLKSIDYFEKHLAYARMLTEEERWEDLKVWMEEAGELHKLFDR
ncbi:MAG: prephenate dehydrogenase [Campylobacterales bacterium]